MTIYDATIIGGGHNGLVCASYLARAGLKVKVFERRASLGGACVTEEFHPGYKASTLAYMLGMMDERVMEELELERFGLKLIRHGHGGISLLPDGRHLNIGDGEQATLSEISKFSPRDADAHVAFERELDAMSVIIKRFIRERPPNFNRGPLEFWHLFKTGHKIRRLSVSQKEKLMNIMTMSLGDYLDMWFESDALKGYYAGLGSLGNFVHPYAAGSAFALLHQFSGRPNGLGSPARQVMGGMGGLARALKISAEAYGAEFQTEAEIIQIVANSIESKNCTGEAYGIKLADGSFIESKKVIANCTPYILFDRLLPENILPDGFLKRMRTYKYMSGTMKINLALKSLPDFTAFQGIGQKSKVLDKTLLISPSIAYIEKAFHDGRISGFPRKPVISMTIPSLKDPSLAPEGHHVAQLMCQHFHKNLPDDMTWETIRDETVEDVLQALSEYAPNIRDILVGYQAFSPHDLETEFGLTGGDINHGAMQLNQMFSFRPAAKFADYRTPVKNLYLCGAGAHPGGGVTGLPGMLCAQEVLKDATRKK